MAICVVKARNELENYNVLAPERYNPRREALAANSNRSTTVPLMSIANVVRKTGGPSSKYLVSCIVVDTSNARDGILNVNSEPKLPIQLGSMKKIVEPNDVIISRLRPYLRQVALIDKDIPYWTKGVSVVCSTEFFVLRSADEESIAFLIPFLLSESV